MDTNLRLTGDRRGILQPDIILPSQYFEPRGRLPEHRLMIAVLQDAIDCVAKHRCARDFPGRRLFDEATRWLLAEETDWLYSFERICAVLDLDANAVRRALGLPPRQSVLASREVKKALVNHDDLRGAKVATKSCVARLSGTLPTGMQRLEAALDAGRTCAVQETQRVA
jgi:hypothetical protein